MKLSQYIQQLEEIIDKNGDVDVIEYSPFRFAQSPGIDFLKRSISISNGNGQIKKGTPVCKFFAAIITFFISGCYAAANITK